MNLSNQQKMIFFAVIALLILATGGWIVKRISVASSRHSLNYQEASKDALMNLIKNGCGNENLVKLWITKDDKRYAKDRLATTNDIYRYMVFDVFALKNESCLLAIISAAQRSSYPASITFSDQGNEIANFYFPKKAN